MSSDRECYVYIVLPGATEFVTAGRFRVSTGPTGDPAGAFVYGRRYRELAEAVELFSRICFNAATSNLDDHPRNHAIVAKDRAWHLSPAFDLTPSPGVAQDHRDLAMTCGRFGRYANRANLLSGCGRLLLRNEEAAVVFQRIVDTVRVTWRSTMQSAGVSEMDCDAIRSAFVYPGLFHDVVEERR